MNLSKQKSDERRESYHPAQMYDEEIAVGDRIGTGAQWAERKRLVLQEVFTSMTGLIDLAYNENRSLAILKPVEVVGFSREEEEERESDPETSF